jgi:hypothetical protein
VKYPTHRNRHLMLLLGALLALGTTGCPQDDPEETVLDTGSDAGGDTGGDMAEDTGADTGGGDMAADAGQDPLTDMDPDAGNDAGGDVSGDATADTGSADADADAGVDLIADPGAAWADFVCEPAEYYYTPDADDDWPACVSDDDEYVKIEENVSTIARVGAFEDIADLLWRGDVPTGDDFISARDLYAVGEGLDSRVQRREDEHYPPVMDGETTLSCGNEGVPAMDPDRCVGPAQMLPILNDAFQQGILGNQPRVQAARIEATLLWFLYISTYKEGTTCASVRKDCDSSWAYYTGGEQRDGGLGLAGYIRDIDTDIHEHVFDGILGLRCWRDVEQDEPATSTELQANALAQMDVALLNGVARIVAERAAAMAQHEGAERDADWAFLQILGPVLDREAATRNATVAAELAAAWEADSADDVDVPELIRDLAEVFPCSE